MSVYVHQNISCLQQDSCTITKANMMFTLFPKRYLKQLLWVSENESENWKWPTLATSCRTEQREKQSSRNPGSTTPLVLLFPVLTAFSATYKCSKMNILHWNSNTKAHFQTVVRRPSFIVTSPLLLQYSSKRRRRMSVQLHAGSLSNCVGHRQRAAIENLTLYFLKCDKWCRWHVGTCGDICTAGLLSVTL